MQAMRVMESFKPPWFRKHRVKQCGDIRYLLVAGIERGGTDIGSITSFASTVGEELLPDRKCFLSDLAAALSVSCIVAVSGQTADPLLLGNVSFPLPISNTVIRKFAA
ncbi:hypothetical protein F2P81_019437 [Scophthalmus maximus]|uniref:Uncharacterized protein n=1 Tax=Scophthalmus maximus TaxID=52904 RepID=A0A6A4S9P5_SCOMX|nr:hypothetical protein F2P81_019437 [Scophthalmus maximus]